jgi:hypothetical protein
MSDTTAPTTAETAEVGAGVWVRAHPGLCEGWRGPHRFAPAGYPLDAQLLDVPADLADAARLGAQVWPARAITVIETNGHRP